MNFENILFFIGGIVYMKTRDFMVPYIENILDKLIKKED